jgi:histidine triad (HIT) family protein
MGREAMTCIFCQIIEGKAPANIIFRDEQVTAFHDARPIAPVHILVVPNVHITSLNEFESRYESLAGHMVNVARQLARELGVSQSGYRLVFNTGPDAGQSIFHLHLHMLGGRVLPFHFK